MPVPFDTNYCRAGTDATNATTGTLTGCTVSAIDNMLVVFLGAFVGGGGAAALSVTWNGAPLTSFGNLINLGAGFALEMWSLANPTAGTGSVVATYSAPLNGSKAIAFIPLMGFSSFGLFQSVNNGGSLPMSFTETGAGTNDVYVAFGISDVTTMTESGANMVSVVKVLGSANRLSALTDYILGTFSGAFSWTGSGDGFNALAVGTVIRYSGVTPSQVIAVPQRQGFNLSGPTLFDPRAFVMPIVATAPNTGATGGFGITQIGRHINHSRHRRN